MNFQFLHLFFKEIEVSHISVHRSKTPIHISVRSTFIKTTSKKVRNVILH